MSKAPVPGPARQLHWHPDGTQRFYEPGRQVYVGSIAGLTAAVANALPGDEIVIDWPGQNNRYRLQNTLVVNAPNVTIRGNTEDASEIVIQGPGMDEPSYGGAPYGIYSQQPGLSLANFTLRDFYHHAVTFGAGATAPSFENLRLLDIGTQFVKISAFPAAINDGRMTGCVVGYTAGRPTTDHGAGFFYGGGVDCHNSTGWIVRGNTFLEFSPTAEEEAATAGQARHLWSPAVYFWNRSANNIVEANVFRNSARSIAFGLINRIDSVDAAHDNVGGIIRNNMCVMDAARLGAYQISQSDGMILAWDSPGTKILHNTIVTNGQVADAIQGRWSAGLEISNNLSNDTIRMRELASYTGGDNTLTAQNSWFVDPSTGNLRLSSTGNTAVGTAARLADCLADFDGTQRDVITKIGASIYG